MKPLTTVFASTVLVWQKDDTICFCAIPHTPFWALMIEVRGGHAHERFSVACRATDFIRALRNAPSIITIEQRERNLFVSGEAISCNSAPEPELPEVHDWILVDLRRIYECSSKFKHPGLRILIEAEGGYLTIKPVAAGALIRTRGIQVRLNKSIRWHGEVRGVDFALLYKAMKGIRAEPREIAMVSRWYKTLVLRHKRYFMEFKAFLSAEPYLPLPSFF